MHRLSLIRNYLLLALILIILDQASKMQIAATFLYAERLVLIPGVLSITLAYNTGAAFSFLASESGWQQWFFIALAGLAIVLLVYWMLQQVSQPRTCVALSMILAGAIGNGIDRLQYGYVIDFILVHWQDVWFFPVFNVADIAISLGAALLILDELLRWKKERSTPHQP